MSVIPFNYRRIKMEFFLTTVTFILISKLISMFVGYNVLLLSRSILFPFVVAIN